MLLPWKRRCREPTGGQVHGETMDVFSRLSLDEPWKLIVLQHATILISLNVDFTGA